MHEQLIAAPDRELSANHGSPRHEPNRILAKRTGARSAKVDAGSCAPGGAPPPPLPPPAGDPESTRHGQLRAAGIQAKLALTTPGDVYEREADEIATEITGGAPSAGLSESAAAPRQVARLPIGPESGSLPSQTEAHVASLPGRGAPLPAEARAFFEPRLGADLSGVRVHSDAAAARAADDVDALAFTVGSDIVFARGHYSPATSAGRRLLAHELVHVLQQRPQGPFRRAEASVQRTAYWSEFDLAGAAVGPVPPRRGDEIHHEILSRIGAQPENSHLFTEAPVPNANRLGEAFGARGSADMYAASTTVGLEFPQHQQPANLPAGPRLHRGGAAYRHAALSAPRVDSDTGEISRIGQAPKTIKLGELKGGLEGLNPTQAAPQLSGYGKGYTRVATELDGYARAHPDKVSSEARFNPAISELHRDDVRIPPEYDPRSAAAQPLRRLVLVYDKRSRDWSVRHRIMGRLFVAESSAQLGQGVWSYFFAPDQPLSVAALPPSVQALGDQITTRLITPILTGPIAAPFRRARAVRRRARMLARKADTFKYETWKQAHDQLAQQSEQPKKSTDYQEAGVAERIEEANAAPRRAGVRIPPASEQAIKGSQLVDRVDFWTGPKADVVAIFRRVFGRVFVGAVDLFFRVRDKLRDLLKGKPKPGRFGSGLFGAAFRAAYMVLKAMARRVLSQTVGDLVDRLKRGTTDKLKAWVGVERLQELEDKADSLQSTREELEASVEQRLEGVLGEDVVGRLTDVLQKVEHIKDVISDITEVVNKVKWGVRVLECLSPPAVGCLWIALQSAAEWAITKVVETCWFQRQIQPLIRKLDFLRELPRTISSTIIEQVQGVLPPSLKDVFAAPAPSGSPPVPDELDCESDGAGGNQLSPEQVALLRLMQRVGEDRYRALVEAMLKSGVPQTHQLTVAQINEAAETIARSGVTAAQLRQFSRDADAVTEEQLVPMKTFLDGLVGTPTAGDGSGQGSTAPGDATQLDFTGVPLAGHEPSQTQFTVKHIWGVGARDKAGTDVKLVLEVEVANRKVTLREVPARVISTRPIPKDRPKWLRLELKVTGTVQFDMTEQARRGLIGYSTLKLTTGQLHKNVPVAPAN